VSFGIDERQRQPLADVPAVIEYERAISPSLGGRTVFDDVRKKRQRQQLRLFNE